MVQQKQKLADSVKSQTENHDGSHNEVPTVVTTYLQCKLVNRPADAFLGLHAVLSCQRDSGVRQSHSAAQAGTQCHNYSSLQPLKLLGFKNPPALASCIDGKLAYAAASKIGCHFLAQAGYELLALSNPLASVSQSLALSARRKCSGVITITAHYSLDLPSLNDSPTSASQVAGTAEMGGSHFVSQPGLKLLDSSDPSCFGLTKCKDYSTAPPVVRLNHGAPDPRCHQWLGQSAAFSCFFTDHLNLLTSTYGVSHSRSGCRAAGQSQLCNLCLLGSSNSSPSVYQINPIREINVDNHTIGNR
ncbi:hypothetical protein AAY473_015018 [Plecturocebus cupreus]